MRRRSMQAMVVKRWGEPFVPEQRPEPKPGPGEAVMRVRVAGAAGYWMPACAGMTLERRA